MGFNEPPNVDKICVCGHWFGDHDPAWNSGWSCMKCGCNGFDAKMNDDNEMKPREFEVDRVIFNAGSPAGFRLTRMWNDEPAGSGPEEVVFLLQEGTELKFNGNPLEQHWAIFVALFSHRWKVKAWGRADLHGAVTRAEFTQLKGG